MPKVRMQSRYWQMVHHGIELSIKECKRKMNRLMKTDAEEKEQKIECIQKDIERYEAIDALIMEAEQKGDSVIWDTNGLGPDYIPKENQEREEETPEDEFRWRTTDSIGY
ncbi:MAG: hypothetical protein IJ215_02450 [Clostridia bacterium]|nr:hypothetical protein [Clostridia bacterium]